MNAYGKNSMTVTRRTHRILGLILLLPICGWALTGFVFFVKPGYDAAYGGLHVRAYSLEGASVPGPRPEWLEVRMLRTVLGYHALVRIENGRLHLNPTTLLARELPDEAAIRRLIGDAIAPERVRYGDIATVTRHPDASPSASIETTTGVKIDLDWTTLGLQQSGRDTRRIDALYRIHYLQWTGIRVVDRVLGALGLASLIILAILGFRLAFPARR
jgi:hypothetical protein